jgi:hypothetical protein
MPTLSTPALLLTSVLSNYRRPAATAARLRAVSVSESTTARLYCPACFDPHAGVCPNLTSTGTD